MRATVAWLSLIALVVSVLALSSCKPKEEEPVVTPPMKTAKTTPEPPKEEPKPEETATPGEPTDIVKAVGVELFEGATSVDCVKVDEGVEATFEVNKPYQEVKDYYLGAATDWKNNGLEGGAMTGNDWEFTSPDGKFAIQITSESMEPPTKIIYKVKCEPGELEELLSGAETTLEPGTEPAGDAEEPVADDAAAPKEEPTL